MKNTWTALLCCIFLFCSPSYAFVYIAPPFDQALQSKERVCVGLVEDVHITGKGEGWIKAQAKISIEKCLRGTHCSEGKYIFIDYFVQNILGTILSLDIELGKQVILATNDNDDLHHYEFDSDINDGLDYCYICDVFPFSIIDHDWEFACRNSMTRNVHNGLTWSHIEKLFPGHSQQP